MNASNIREPEGRPSVWQRFLAQFQNALVLLLLLAATAISRVRGIRARRCVPYMKKFPAASG